MQPYYIRQRDDRILALAGLWEQWLDPDGDSIDSYTILTTEPNQIVRQLHNRMPAIVEPESYGLWLDSHVQDVEPLRPLFHPYPPDELTAHAVSTHVNNPVNDDPSCIRPL